MIDRYQVYKCEHCGNIIEVLHGGGARIQCCGSAMVLQEEKTEDAAVEKHVPFIEKTDGGITVRVGQNAAHPMEDDHYIEWIQILVDGVEHTHDCKPGDEPSAVFTVTGENIVAREYCNKHGLWKGEG